MYDETLLEIRETLLKHFEIPLDDNTYKFYISHFLDYIEKETLIIENEERRLTKRNELYSKLLRIWDDKCLDLTYIGGLKFLDLYWLMRELEFLNTPLDDKIRNINKIVYNYLVLGNYFIDSYEQWQELEYYKVTLLDLIRYITEKIKKKARYNKHKFWWNLKEAMLNIFNNWSSDKEYINDLSEEEIDNLYILILKI